MTVVVISPEIKIYHHLHHVPPYLVIRSLALKITDAWLSHLDSTVSAKSETCLANTECTYLVARTFSEDGMRY